MRKLFLLLLITMFSALAWAQERNVTGRITAEEDGTPVPGATVLLKGTNIGVATDMDGRYTIRVPATGGTILFTFVGKLNQEIQVGTSNVVDVVMANDVFGIDELVVVAYGTQKKRNLTSSVSSVKGEDLINSPVASLQQAMQGKLSGVQISSATGAPGGAIVVNVRGTSSISAGNDPLYVVDGIPIISSDISNRGNSYQGNNLSGVVDINPADIESIDVLKDASASALYGSRASNGVIIITTKKGRSEKTKVTLSSSFGKQELIKKLDFLGATDYVAARNEGIDNYNTSLGLTPADASYKNHINAVVAGANTDWFDEITRTAYQTNNQLAISGGDAKTTFYFSGGLYTQQGLQLKTDYNRYNLRSNLEHSINKRLRLSSNIGLSASTTNRSTGDGNIYSPWGNAYNCTPDQPVYNTDGSYFTTNDYNPVHLVNGQTQTSIKYRALIGLKADWNIWDNLTYHVNLSGDYNLLKEIGYYPVTSLQGATAKGQSEDYRTLAFSSLMEHTLDYHKSIGAFNLSGLLGYSYQKKRFDASYVIGQNFVSTTLKYIDAASVISSGSSSVSECALQSLFGRISLDYADRFLFVASLRSDASSKFAPDKRVGYFPAMSFGWRISKEEFFPKNDVLTDLKLRASFGLTGNQEGIGYYNFYNIFSASNIKYDGQPGLALPFIKYNPDLTWEKTTQYGAGLDLILLSGHIDFTFDWYYKDTKDLLLTHTINSLSGFSTMTSNVGSITNSGLEFNLTSHNVTKNTFSWTTNFNLSYAKNEITGLSKNPSGQDVPVEIGYVNRLEVGQPFGAFYLVRALGVYQSEDEILAEDNGQALWDSGIRPGDMKYLDKDNNGIINDADREFCGSPAPKFFGSLANTINYKGFDLSIDLQGVFGNKLYAYWKSLNGAGNLGGFANQLLASEWENRWTESNPSNSVPRAVASGTAFSRNTIESDRWLEDGSFVRVKNVTLGYELPKSFTNKLLITHARLYVTANNLYTFTKYDGWDPEVTMFPDRTDQRGTDVGIIPQPRSYIFGINLTF